MLQDVKLPWRLVGTWRHKASCRCSEWCLRLKLLQMNQPSDQHDSRRNRIIFVSLAFDIGSKARPLYLHTLTNSPLAKDGLTLLKFFFKNTCVSFKKYYVKRKNICICIYMDHSMRNLHPKILFWEKYVLSRSMLKNNRHIFFCFNVIFENFKKWIIVSSKTLCEYFRIEKTNIKYSNLKKKIIVYKTSLFCY